MRFTVVQGSVYVMETQKENVHGMFRHVSTVVVVQYYFLVFDLFDHCCVLQLLFQETNPGVRYEYTISRNISEDNNIPASVFYWKYGSWTECSVTCGAGKSHYTTLCFW